MYYSYCCYITNHLEIRAISNDHFIMLMDSMDEELGKTQGGHMLLAHNV